ncbi:MAG: hypothetical protein KKI08_03140, partial [Armatimonadetes bacterium]|nr:hypothetical protein [Armatimonadota bacterium]
LEARRAGSGPGQFSGPRAVALGPSGQLIIADTGNRRLQVFAAGKTDQPLSVTDLPAGPVAVTCTGDQVVALTGAAQQRQHRSEHLLDARGPTGRGRGGQAAAVAAARAIQARRAAPGRVTPAPQFVSTRTTGPSPAVPHRRPRQCPRPRARRLPPGPPGDLSPSGRSNSTRQGKTGARANE